MQACAMRPDGLCTGHSTYQVPLKRGNDVSHAPQYQQLPAQNIWQRKNASQDQVGLERDAAARDPFGQAECDKDRRLRPFCRGRRPRSVMEAPFGQRVGLIDDEDIRMTRSDRRCDINLCRLYHIPGLMQYSTVMTRRRRVLILTADGSATDV